MNLRLVTNTLGYILWVEAGFMTLPLITSLLYGDGCYGAFLGGMLICVIVGMLLRAVPVKAEQMQRRDGYGVVALSWIGLSFFGCLPYMFSKAIPNFFDALFETVSGLTTTGSTILTEIEHLQPSILIWRSETQWMGGMGVLVLFLAIMRRMKDGAVYMMRAESPGPIKSKLVPKVGQTAKILYLIYVTLTVLEMISLKIAGMTWFDAINHCFTTMATGGFSTKNASIAAFADNPWIIAIIIIFTIFAGVNFSLVFLAVTGKIKEVLRNEELRWFLILIIVSTSLIAFDLNAQTGEGLKSSAGDALFQVTTIITTTGYATKNFELWPVFSKTILVLLMYVGSCAGSTAGGMKISRIILLFKSMIREFRQIIHPNRISVVTMDGQPVEEKTLKSANAFLFAYLLVLIVGTLVVSLDNIGFVESFVASLTCISNVGPALGALGPVENFSILSEFSKFTLSIIMLMGRLELMPIFVLFLPATWKK